MPFKVGGSALQKKKMEREKQRREDHRGSKKLGPSGKEVWGPGSPATHTHTHTHTHNFSSMELVCVRDHHQKKTDSIGGAYTHTRTHTHIYSGREKTLCGGRQERGRAHLCMLIGRETQNTPRVGRSIPHSSSVRGGGGGGGAFLPKVPGRRIHFLLLFSTSLLAGAEILSLCARLLACCCFYAVVICAEVENMYVVFIIYLIMQDPRVGFQRRMLCTPWHACCLLLLHRRFVPRSKFAGCAY